MLSEGHKVSLPKYTREARVGPKLIRGEDLVRLVAVRTVFDLPIPSPFESDNHFYEADPTTVSPVEDLMPSWKLLYSINPFPSGTYADRMRTGKNLNRTHLPHHEVGIGQDLYLRGKRFITGHVRRLNRPTEIFDWNDESLIVTGVIELKPSSGQDKIAGRIGSAFEDVFGRPVGILISRSETAWFLAPLVPFLKSSQQAYSDQLATDRDRLIKKMGEAPILKDAA